MHDKRFAFAESYRDGMNDMFMPSEFIFTYEAGDMDTDEFAYVTMDMVWVDPIFGKTIPVTAKEIMDKMTYAFKLTYEEVDEDGDNLALYVKEGPKYWSSVYIDVGDKDRAFDPRAFKDGVRVLITIDMPEYMSK